MSEWKEYKLGDICDVTSSRRIFLNEYVKNGVPFYRSKEIIEKAKGNHISTELFITEQRFNEIKKKNFIPVENDILITSVGTLGVSYLVSIDDYFYFKDGNLTWLRNYSDAVYPKYLLYWLRSIIAKEKFNEISIGSTQPAITIQGLKGLLLKLPPFPTQTAIAEILSSLDDKIELNNKINQELETLAQILFKQWFIDFEFPNENGEPYKSSGGEMVESELGEIPKGWEVGKFDDLVKISTGKGINKKDYQENGGYAVIGANGIMGFYKDYNIDGFKILTGRVGTLGTVRISNEKVWTSDNVLICEPFVKESNHYSFFVMKGFDFNALNRGSTQPLITQTDLKSQIILLPEINILTIFQNQMDYFLSLIELNKIEISRLTNLRDTLLPKLISGELEINEIAN